MTEEESQPRKIHWSVPHVPVTRPVAAQPRPAPRLPRRSRPGFRRQRLRRRDPHRCPPVLPPARRAAGAGVEPPRPPGRRADRLQPGTDRRATQPGAGRRVHPGGSPGRPARRLRPGGARPRRRRLHPGSAAGGRPGQPAGAHRGRRLAGRRQRRRRLRASRCARRGPPRAVPGPRRGQHPRSAGAHSRGQRAAQQRHRQPRPGIELRHSRPQPAPGVALDGADGRHPGALRPLRPATVVAGAGVHRQHGRGGRGPRRRRGALRAAERRRHRQLRDPGDPRGLRHQARRAQRTQPQLQPGRPEDHPQRADRRHRRQRPRRRPALLRHPRRRLARAQRYADRRPDPQGPLPAQRRTRVFGDDPVLRRRGRHARRPRHRGLPRRPVPVDPSLRQVLGPPYPGQRQLRIHPQRQPEAQRHRLLHQDPAQRLPRPGPQPHPVAARILGARPGNPLQPGLRAGRKSPRSGHRPPLRQRSQPRAALLDPRRQRPATQHRQPQRPRHPRQHRSQRVLHRRSHRHRQLDHHPPASATRRSIPNRRTC